MRRIRAVLLDCGDTLVDEATEVKDGLQVSQRADLIPGADELIWELKRRGYPLALVADGPEGTFINNLTPHDLYNAFDAYAISGILGVEKPHADIFHYALRTLGVTAEDYARVVMMGNNLGRDIKGANAIGIISVWLDWSPRRSKTPADVTETPHYSIKNPLELLAVLDRLEHLEPDAQPGRDQNK